MILVEVRTLKAAAQQLARLGLRGANAVEVFAVGEHRPDLQLSFPIAGIGQMADKHFVCLDATEGDRVLCAYPRLAVGTRLLAFPKDPTLTEIRP